MSAAYPTPWTLFVHDEQEGGDGEVSICAEGEWIATMNLRRSTAKDDAALIVAAVNWYCDWGAMSAELERLRAERDQLRAIVRRIETEMERCHRRDGGISQELMDAVYEASAAIEEKKK